MPKIAHCHKALRSVAQALAGELYENLMSNTKIYDHWKSQNPECTPKQLETRFVARNWGKCLEAARAVMTAQLLDPNVPELQKDEIIEILRLDSTLMRGRERKMVEVIGTSLGNDAPCPPLLH